MTFKLFILLLLLLLFIWLALVYNIYLILAFFNFNKRAPYVPSFDSHLRIMKQKLKLLPWKKLIDLGCWDGKILRFFASNFWLICEWYEINLSAIIYWKIINFFRRPINIKIYKQNFLKADLKKYDYVYLYLLTSQLAKIEDRIFQNIKKNTIIISNSFKFTNHQAFQTIKNDRWRDCIFLYRK